MNINKLVILGFCAVHEDFLDLNEFIAKLSTDDPIELGVRVMTRSAAHMALCEQFLEAMEMDSYSYTMRNKKYKVTSEGVIPE